MNISGKAKEKVQKLRDILEEKLSLYNKKSKTQFNFLFENPVITENIPKKSMWSIAGGILGLFFGASFGEFIFRKKSSKRTKNKN